MRSTRIAFDVELLDVDERRLGGQVVGALLLQVERIDLVIAGKGAPHAPLDALGRNALVDAQSVKDLQRLLRVADAARRRPLTPTVLSSSSSTAATPWRASAAGQREPGDAATHDDDGVWPGWPLRDFRRLHKRVFGQHW
jgi:hypothetical protein